MNSRITGVSPLLNIHNYCYFGVEHCKTVAVVEGHIAVIVACLNGDSFSNVLSVLFIYSVFNLSVP